MKDQTMCIIFCSSFFSACKMDNTFATARSGGIRFRIRGYLESTITMSLSIQGRGVWFRKM